MRSRIHRPFPAWTALLAGLTFGGCATVKSPAPGAAASPAPPPPSAGAEAAAASFHPDLRDARARAWQTALDIARVYALIPEAQCPGIAALVRDIEEARRRVSAAGSAQLDELDADALVTRNPNFWRASLEIAPTDGSLLLLHAMLLASAGEVWRANRILMATTQLLPIDARSRPLYLSHTYGLGAIILDSVEGLDARTAGVDAARVESIYREALAAWPGNVLVLSALVELQERTAAGRDDAQAAPTPDVERLFALDPINAAPYRGDAEARQHGRKLVAQWQRLGNRSLAFGHKDIGEMIAELERAEAHELALVLQRLLVVTRGFASPGDTMAWRRLLPRLIGEPAAEAIMTDWAEGSINTVALTGSDPDAGEWPGDPAANPILRFQLERELGERTFRIEMLRAQPGARAQAYRERGLLRSQAGLFPGALADFEAAIELAGREPSLLLGQAAVHAALQRDAEAEALFAELAAGRESRQLAAVELGAFRYGQGRFAEARTSFRDEARRRPESGWPAILADLAARRTGGAERRLVARSLARLPAGSWLAYCLRFVQGETGADELLRRAREGGELEVAGQLSEAYFLLAQTELAAGNEAGGIAHLESCIGAGMANMIEFRLARLELRRLAPEREARLREPPAEPGSRRAPPAAPREPDPASEPARGRASPT